MILLERSTDWPLIQQIVTHPKVYPQVSDDYSPRPEEWEPVQSGDLWYVLVRDLTSVPSPYRSGSAAAQIRGGPGSPLHKDRGEILGLWMLHPHLRSCWEIHTCLLPNAYGSRARQAVQALIPWGWEHLPECVRVITQVPQYNRIALLFAIQAGMEQYGINPKSYLKGGKLHDMILLGISRPGA